MFSLFIISSLFVIFQSSPSANGELLNVVVVLRHGARSPAKFFSINKFSNLQYWPEGTSELTNTGRRELFELGQKLNSQYKTFIEPHNLYKSKDIQAVSTNTSRTLESAAILLSSLYPPSKEQQWNTEYNWTPVPIPISGTVDGNNCRKCPSGIVKRNEAMKELESNPQYQKYVTDVSTHDTQGEMKSILDYIGLLDNVASEKKEGYKTIDWLDKYTKGEFSQAVQELKSKFFSGSRSVRLCSGPLIQDIVSKINNVINGGPSSKIYLYSGHEGTLRGIAQIFNITLKDNPDFASSIIFETHRNEPDNYVIKMFYNHNASLTHEEMEIPNCGFDCPFNNFVGIVNPFIPNDWNAECNEVAHRTKRSPPPRVSTLQMSSARGNIETSITVCVLLLLTSILLS